MFKWIFIAYLLQQMYNIDQCEANSHLITGISTKQGSKYGALTFLNRVLFVRNTTTPKSYVVGFKYVGDPFSTIIHSGIIHSDAPDTYGHGNLSNGIDMRDNHYLNAEMHIQNATHFQVDVKLRGQIDIENNDFTRWLQYKEFRLRTLALICAIDKNQPKIKYRQLMFGAREDGDVILHARKTIFSSTDSQLPRYKIEFEDDDAIITAAMIQLNSTRAIVFHNKVQLTEYRFSATIYGLNRDKIAGALIIYGHRT